MHVPNYVKGQMPEPVQVRSLSITAAMPIQNLSAGMLLNRAATRIANFECAIAKLLKARFFLMFK